MRTKKKPCDKSVCAICWKKKKAKEEKKNVEERTKKIDENEINQHVWFHFFDELDELLDV